MYDRFCGDIVNMHCGISLYSYGEKRRHIILHRVQGKHWVDIWIVHIRLIPISLRDGLDIEMEPCWLGSVMCNTICKQIGDLIWAPYEYRMDIWRVHLVVVYALTFYSVLLYNTVLISLSRHDIPIQRLSHTIVDSECSHINGEHLSRPQWLKWVKWICPAYIAL